MTPPNHLRRRLLSILALAALLFLTACPLPAPAQIPSGYVQTTATVPALANGSFGASWTNLSSSPQLALLGCVSTFQQTVSGSFNANGSFSVLLADTSQICPSPSTWTFNFTFACPVGTPASSFQVQVAVIGGGGTADISSQIIAALPSTYCSGGGGGSSSIKVNGSPVSSPNFNGLVPAAPGGGTNCQWQVSGPSVSCYLPSSTYPGVTSPGTGGLAGNSGSGQTWEIFPNGTINGTAFQVSGNPFGTANLADWTDAGVANGYVPIWNSSTLKWTPGPQTGGGGGNSPTVVTTINPSVRSGGVTGYDAIPVLTPWCDIRSQGAVIDGTTAIDSAVQACINVLFSKYGSTGTILLPCVRQNSTGAGCYLQNSSLLTGPSAGTVKFELQGALQLGSTLVAQYWQSWFGLDGGPDQFQTGTVPAFILGPNVNGTLGTAITSAATATTITPTFANGSIANLPVNSAITIAGVRSSTATAVRIACTAGLANCPYGSGQTTLTYSTAALRIPPGEILTVGGCSDSSFNTVNNAVSHSDYTAQQLVYFQTDATPSTATGCTVTGFNEDVFESARILCSNGVSGTFNGVTYSSCSTGQVTILTSHTHIGTDQWGEVVAGPAFNTYTPQTFKDINFGYGTGMAFWAEGSTNLEMDNVGVTASNYITSGAMECSACYRNKFHNLFSAATEFSQSIPVCPGGGCTQPSYPYALRLDSDVTGFYYSSTQAGCPQCDFDQGPEFIGGIKIDGSGVAGRAITGLPRFQSPMTEEVWNAVFTIDNRAGIESQDALSIKDPFNQDNISGWSQPLVNYTDGNLPPTGCVAIERGSYLAGLLYGSYFNSPCEIDDSTLDPVFAVPQNEAGPSGSYNQGNMNEVESQNEGSGFGPQILPFGSLAVPGFTQSLLATACSGGYACTATSVPGPDGPSGEMPAVQIVSTGNGFSGVIATDTRQTYAGDRYVYWSWIRPIAGQPFTLGAGNAGANNSFSVTDAYSTFAATNCGTGSCSAATAWPQAFGTGVSNNGWSPQVAIATVLTGNGGSHNVTLALGLASAAGTGNQWAEPGWAFIPGPNNPACTAAGTCNLSADQIEEARRDQYHGFVPPGSTAGQAVTGEPIAVNNTNVASQSSLTYNTGHAPVPGSSTTASWAPDSSGNFTVSDGTGAYARPCTAGNGLCDSPVSTIVSSGAITVTAQNTYVICTTTCTVTPLAPAANVQLCVQNDVGVSSVITLAALGSGKYYGLVDHSAYGTANHTLVSGGAVGDQVCLTGKDTTHYNPWASAGTWTD